MFVVPSIVAAGSKTAKNSSNFKINKFHLVKRWIMDTGSGVDICSFADVPNKSQGLQKSNVEITFNTANGPVDAGPLFPGILEPFTEAIAPFVLPQTPALLSVGKRCMEKG